MFEHLQVFQCWTIWNSFIQLEPDSALIDRLLLFAHRGVSGVPKLRTPCTKKADFVSGVPNPGTPDTFIARERIAVKKILPL